MKKKWYYKPGLSWERRKKFLLVFLLNVFLFFGVQAQTCLLYTSDAADD